MSRFAITNLGGPTHALAIAVVGGFALGHTMAARPARTPSPPMTPAVTAPPAARPERCATTLPAPDPHPARPPELEATELGVVARISVLGPDGAGGREAIVRSIGGGWCQLVPPGPPITFAVANEWIWFARAVNDTPGAAIVLSRVAIDGGAIQPLADLPRLPDALSVNDGRLYVEYGDDREFLLPVYDALYGGGWDYVPLEGAAPAERDELPPIPAHAHSLEVIRSNRLARVSIGDYRLDEMVVRTTRDGWCVVVPAGPPLTMVAARGWLYFVRPESNQPGAPVWLARVPVSGGPITQLDRVPSVPEHLTYRNGDLMGWDGDLMRWDGWTRGMFDDTPPSSPGPCGDETDDDR